MVVGSCVDVTPDSTAEVSSLHPQNRPGVMHVVVAVDVVDVVVVTLVVVLSLHPNQPGVRHVVVVVVVVVEVVVTSDVSVPVAVVDSSKQPHQPGVLQVSVRVRVMDVVVGALEVVVDSVPLLSYIFQLPQSLHSGVNLHSGTVSYFKMTSRITARILCVPIPTRQPLSPTVS
jgi:hypothetical protein